MHQQRLTCKRAGKHIRFNEDLHVHTAKTLCTTRRKSPASTPSKTLEIQGSESVEASLQICRWGGRRGHHDGLPGNRCTERTRGSGFAGLCKKHDIFSAKVCVAVVLCGASAPPIRLGRPQLQLCSAESFLQPLCKILSKHPPPSCPRTVSQLKL